MLTSDAVAAVEDAFLRGEWTQALSDSRSILAARIVQVQSSYLCCISGFCGISNGISNFFTSSDKKTETL
jgi:hypothetical protein